MKALAAGIVLLLQTGQTVEMSVFASDQMVGSATVTETLTADKGKTTHVRMVLGPVTVVQESEYDSKGTPMRKFVRQTGGGDEMRMVTFSGRNARAVIEKDGKRTVQDVPAPEGANISASSEMWFLTTRPRVGQVDTHHRFDLGQLKWIESVAKYEGPTQITVGGKTVRAHRVSMRGLGDSWIDDNGRPLRLVIGSVRMEAKG